MDAASELTAALCAAARRLLTLRLNVGTAGNLSVRHGEGYWITPSGLHPEQMQAADIVYCDADGRAQGPHKPSSEWQIHRALYRTRAQIGAVVHMHSPHATALSCLRLPLPPFHYTIARFGGEDVRCAEYAPFATTALADTVVAAMQDRNACLMANHGATVCGRTLEDAIDQAIELEYLCELYLRARHAGEPILLNAEEMQAIGRRYRDYCARGD